MDLELLSIFFLQKLIFLKKIKNIALLQEPLR